MSLLHHQRGLREPRGKVPLADGQYPNTVDDQLSGGPAARHHEAQDSGRDPLPVSPQGQLFLRQDRVFGQRFRMLLLAGVRNHRELRSDDPLLLALQRRVLHDRGGAGAAHGEGGHAHRRGWCGALGQDRQRLAPVRRGIWWPGHEPGRLPHPLDEHERVAESDGGFPTGLGRDQWQVSVRDDRVPFRQVGASEGARRCRGHIVVVPWHRPRRQGKESRARQDHSIDGAVRAITFVPENAWRHARIRAAGALFVERAVSSIHAELQHRVDASTG
mmetsp:Transcript_76352/g.221695  ORF Transcript_76352/g.221695 Transcript_76352/m.221695 type:complete len:274 (+) Transcript_76352:3971-4792(+)